MAHEIYAMELVAEAAAGGQRGLEIGLAEHIGIDFALGDDGSIARLAADQRNLAEEIARPQPRHLVIGTDHVDLAVRDHEKLIPRLPLANDGLAGSEMAFLDVLRDIAELLRGQRLKQIDRAQELADPQSI